MSIMRHHALPQVMQENMLLIKEINMQRGHNKAAKRVLEAQVIGAVDESSVSYRHVPEVVVHAYRIQSMLLLLLQAPFKIRMGAVVDHTSHMVCFILASSK